MKPHRKRLRIGSDEIETRKARALRLHGRLPAPGAPRDTLVTAKKAKKAS